MVTCFQGNHLMNAPFRQMRFWNAAIVLPKTHQKLRVHAAVFTAFSLVHTYTLEQSFNQQKISKINGKSWKVHSNWNIRKENVLRLFYQPALIVYCTNGRRKSPSAYHLYKPCTNCFPFVNTQNLPFRSPPLRAFSMRTMIVLVWTHGQNVSKCIRFLKKTHLC